MKTSFLTFFVIITFLFILGCEPDKPPINSLDKSQILTIDSLYNIYATNGEYSFTEEKYLYGIITADEQQSQGNFYKEAYIQENNDSKKGINLFRLQENGIVTAGSYVRINLKDAILKEYSGKMEISFENVSSPKNQIITIETGLPIKPAEVSVEDILTNIYDCVLVTINDVQFATTDTALNFAEISSSSNTNRNIVDCNKNNMFIRTSDQCDFAGVKVPKGKGSITGVITKFVKNSTTTEWQLFISDPDKIKMNEKRCE